MISGVGPVPTLLTPFCPLLNVGLRTRWITAQKPVDIVQIFPSQQRSLPRHMGSRNPDSLLPVFLQVKSICKISCQRLPAWEVQPYQSKGPLPYGNLCGERHGFFPHFFGLQGKFDPTVVTGWHRKLFCSVRTAAATVFPHGFGILTGAHAAGPGDVADKASGRGQSLKSRDACKVRVKALILPPSAHLQGRTCTHATLGGTKCTQLCIFVPCSSFTGVTYASTSCKQSGGTVQDELIQTLSEVKV